MASLRCIFNVESNLLDNMPYDLLFERGIHTVTTGAVFAEPVAELGLGAGARPGARHHRRRPRLPRGARALGRRRQPRRRGCSRASEVGIVGFGDLGRALIRLLAGFRRAGAGLRPLAAAVDAGRATASSRRPRRRARGQRLRLRRRRGDQREPRLPRRRGLRPDAPRRRLHPAQPRRRRRLRGADRGGPRGRIVAASDVFPEEPLARRPPGAAPCRASCARRTAPARSTSPSSAWATWCSRTWR